eukprot:107852_1
MMASFIEVDPQRVANINQETKNIVYGYIREAECLFAGDNSYFIVADLIKHLCLLYYNQLFNSLILTAEEQQKFSQLLCEHNKDFITKAKSTLLYRGTRDGFNDRICEMKCEDKNNLICFIHTVNNNVLGGYTQSGWSSGTTDFNAFIFALRSSKGYKSIISKVRKSDEGYGCFFAIRSVSSYYLFFGEGAIRVHNDGYVYHNNPKSYELLPKSCYLLGGNELEKIVEIELFVLKSTSFENFKLLNS